MSTRVVLAYDHVLLRQCLRMLLDAELDIEVVGEADNGAEAVDRVDEVRPDVVVMDLVMPGLDGIHATQRIHDEHPEVRIVITSATTDDAAVVPAVRAGAIGFVTRTASTDDLLATVRAAAQGQVTFTAATSALLVQELRAPVEQPERLTSRELEVVECVAQGLSNKEIAWQLRISEKTVKSHVSTILGKFGLESRTQAALHATRTGLVSSESSAVHRGGACSVIALDAHRRRPLARAARI
jgi:DNA-binding NarL/FixJ family response regulator